MSEEMVKEVVEETVEETAETAEAVSVWAGKLLHQFSMRA